MATSTTSNALAPGARSAGDVRLGVRSLAAFARAHRVALAMALVMLAALALRLINLGHNSLTHDECIRANWAYNGDMGLVRWFPPGQLGLMWSLQHWLSRSEWALRLPAVVLGVTAVFLCFSVTRRHIGQWGAVLAAAYLALNYHAIFFSRAAKSLGNEPALALLLIWAGARACETTQRSHILMFFALALLGLLFAFSPIIVAAAWGPWILRACWRRRTEPANSLRFFLTLSVAFVPIVLAWYVWLMGASYRQATFDTLGTTDHAWPTGYSLLALASWGFDNTFGLMRFVTGVRGLWQPIGPVLLALGMLFVLIGIGEMWRRWPGYLKFAGTALVLNIVLALAAKWPYGNYRMSVFMLVIFAPLFGCGLACLLRRLRSWPAGAFLVLLWLSGPAIQSTKGTIIDPREADHARPVVAAMQAHVEPDDAILVYYAAQFSFNFYWTANAAEVHIQDLGSRERFELFRDEFDTLAKTHRRVWVFFTHVWEDEGEDWSAYALRDRRVLHEFRSIDAFAYCVEIEQ